VRRSRGAVPLDRPRTLVLAAIVAVAASMYGWEAAHAEYHAFYAVAARSMTTGWRAFVFGALDPNASITIDKIPGFLWPQALSAMVFGFHPWSLALPQVFEGIITVLALNAAVRRWIGPTGGLLAAGIFALTPVAASLFGKALEDAALTCALVLAASAWQRAVLTGKPGWLLLCGVWVGLGFQAKMMQAWAVLPAFAIAYLIAAPPPRWLTRLWHTLAAGAVCVAVSLSWVIIATLTPAGDRPYIDGSTNNSAIAMVFGYNGLARFSSVGVSAAGTGSVAASQGGNFGGGNSGFFKLFEHDLASQIGWLYPVAAAGILLGLWRGGRAGPTRLAAAH
jgi:4-amino-4-deoxy-L-arabinose transferase-like glycosyltransferase